MIQTELLMSWIDDEIEIVHRHREFFESHILAFLIPGIISEALRYETSLKTLKRCIELGMYDCEGDKIGQN